MAKTKYTKWAIRAAIKRDDQAEVWHLAAIKYGHTPTGKEVCRLVEEVADTTTANHKAYKLAYTSMRKEATARAMELAWFKRGGYRQYDIHHGRAAALKMLRRLLEEPVTAYTKVPVLGASHLYFVSPVYMGRDYNKVTTCAVDNWAIKAMELGQRIYAKKAA